VTLTIQRPDVLRAADSTVELEILVGSAGPGRDLAAAIECWQEWARRPLPDVMTARAEFGRTLARDGDLADRQAADVVERLTSAPGRQDLVSWLAEAVERLVRSVRPWFALWSHFTSWLLHWVTERRYDVVAFLCRDAVPFYALTAEEGARLGSVPELRLLHASRRTAADGRLAQHFARVLPARSAVAFVDSGCYGSLLPLVLDGAGRHCDCPRPAVLFFFSRNPLVFGYMNHLTASGHLDDQWDHRDRSQLDFAIYAGDVLESFPKGYRVVGIGPYGEPLVEPQDLVSYVAAVALLAELRAYVHGDRPQNARTVAEELYAEFLRAGHEHQEAATTLLSEPAPKSPPEQLEANPAYRAGFPPQDEFFGVVSA
jgi:hypothetical protein